MSGFWDGTLVVWDVQHGHEQMEQQFRANAQGIAFSPDGAILAAGIDDGTLILWDTRTWKPFCPPLRGHQLGIHSVAFSPDGTRLASSGGTGEEAVLLWDVAARRQVATLRSKGRFFWCVSFSPDGNTIAAKSDDGNLHFWRVPSWAEIEAAEQEQRSP